MFQKNDITGAEKTLFIKIKKFTPFLTIWISQKNTLTTPRAKFIFRKLIIMNIGQTSTTPNMRIGKSLIKQKLKWGFFFQNR